MPVLILLSGGVDSGVCLHYYMSRGADVTCLHVDYGQAARRMEGAAARAICSYFHVPLDTVVLTGVPPSGTGLIQGRNAALLAIALLSAPFDVGLVALGVHAGTHYVDCSPQFIVAHQGIYDLYTGGTVRIDAPLLDWYKHDIYQYAHMNSIPVELTYSCETGNDVPCGSCASCTDRSAMIWSKDVPG